MQFFFIMISGQLNHPDIWLHALHKMNFNSEMKKHGHQRCAFKSLQSCNAFFKLIRSREKKKRMWLIIVFQFCSWIPWQALHFITLNSYSNWISECQVGVSSVWECFEKFIGYEWPNCSVFFVFVRKGLMAKKWRQGHLLLKLNTEFDNTCRCWMLSFCALKMRLGALLLPRLQQEKMRLQQI